jgi:hypothetical protein
MLPYGRGRVVRNPGWVTGNETPSQRDRRFREINEAIEAQRKRDEEVATRRLFQQFEGMDARDLRLSPPSPPRGSATPTPLPEDIMPTKLGTQDRYEHFLDDRLGRYEAVFGMTPLFGSQAYEAAERGALDDWRGEQSHVPDDIVNERESGFSYDPDRAPLDPLEGVIQKSRVLREGTTRPTPDVDSRYDIMLDSIRADVAAEFIKEGVKSEGEALRYAGKAVGEWLKEVEGEAREALGDVDDQTIREWTYRQLRIQEYLSDVLDEWALPRDAKGEPRYIPQEAVDEALRREAEENGDFFLGFPDQPGLLETITSVFSMKWIPTLDPSKGFKPTFATLDDVHRGGQFYADPTAHYALEGIAQPVRGGELAFEEVTGVETRTVSSALQSQLAEDIVSEVISPEFVVIALPFAGVGIRGLTGAAKIARITANLLGTGMEPTLVRGTFRGLTAFARNPGVISQIPKAIRESEFFLRGIENLRAVKAGLAGRGLSHEEWVKAIGADNPVRVRRVTKDLAQGNATIPDNLPLRQAIEADLSSGRSMEDIIEEGLTVPKGLRAAEDTPSGIVADFFGHEGSPRVMAVAERAIDQSGGSPSRFEALFRQGLAH